MKSGQSTLRVLVLLLGGLTSVAVGQGFVALGSQRYEVDPQHSSVGFVIRMLGFVRVHGRFTDYQGTIVYDPEHPEASSVTAVIKTESINTDMAFRDAHLKTADFFDVATFPTIVFESQRVERQGQRMVALGALSMHGISRQVAIPFDVVLSPSEISVSGTMRTAFQGALRLSRQDFAIAGTNKFNPGFNPANTLLSDSVDVELDLLAERPGYRNRTFTGRSPPSIADTVARTLEQRGVMEAIRVYQAVRLAQPTAFNVSPGQLDALGHVLMSRNRPADAVAILRFNAELFPTVNGVFESLGEAYVAAGDRSGAITAYEKALQVDATSSSAREMLRRLRAAAPRDP